MMPRLVLLAAIAALIALFVDFTRVEPEPHATADADSPRHGYYLSAAQVTDYGPDGQVRLEVAAQQAEQDPERDSVAMQDVRVDYFALPNQRWQLTAHRGDAPSGFQTVTLSGDVVMSGQQFVPEGRAIVRTEQLTLEPAARRAYTAEPVSLVFGAYLLSATGLEADLNAATLRLESGVNGRFIR